MTIAGGALGLILGGCCSNVFFLEKLIRQHPESGELLTALQFLVISVLSLRNFGNPRKWLVPSLIYFVVCVLNNRVWAYHVSVPVHTIVRSSGTALSMLIGMALGKSYSRRQIVGVVMITSGVAMSTVLKDSEQSTKTGLVLLSMATVLAAVQSWYASSIEGGTWQQSLCMTHTLCLPGFLLFRDSILSQAREFSAQDLGWLFLNCTTQYLCAMGVNKLVMTKGPVALNVTLTLRKFISLAISAVIFGGVSGRVLVSGLLVFTGSLVFSS